MKALGGKARLDEVQPSLWRSGICIFTVAKRAESMEITVQGLLKDINLTTSLFSLSLTVKIYFSTFLGKNGMFCNFVLIKM